MAKYYEFRLLPDFAGTTPSKSITDAYMNVHYWDQFQFEIGKFKQPFSYEHLIQDRYVPSMERSMMDQLVPQRDEGAMIHGEKLFCGRFDYAFAVSNGNPNDTGVDDNNDKDLNGRIVVRPFYGDECELLRGLRIGISGSIGVENDTVSSTSSTPPTITTPATVTWFAYNSGVLANGVRHRISPELVYFYHSFGFASQYYHQDQDLQASSAKPIVNVGIDGYYVMATYLLTGEERTGYSQQIDPIRPSILRADSLAGGLGTGVPRRPAGGRPVGIQRRNAVASNSGTDTSRSIEQRSLGDDLGRQLVLDQVGPGATQLGTCQLRQPRAVREHEESRLRKKTRCTRGSRSSSKQLILGYSGIIASTLAGTCPR